MTAGSSKLSPGKVWFRAAISVVFLLCSATFIAAAPQKGGEDETGPYEVVTGWPKPLGHPGWTWGSQGGVFAETPNRIWIANRGELPAPEKADAYASGYVGTAATTGKPRMENCILVVDGEGNLLENWTQHDKLFVGGRG